MSTSLGTLKSQKGYEKQMGTDHSERQRRHDEAELLSGWGGSAWPAVGGGQCYEQLSLNLVFFHSKQKPRACWQWSHIPRVERAERPWGARLGGSKHGDEADFQGCAVQGLPGETGPVLIFTRCSSDLSWDGRGEQGSRSPNMA